MTKQSLPNSPADQQPAQSAQPNRNGVRKNPRCVLVGSIALFAFVLIVASIMVSMQGRIHQTAERARVTVQGATIAGPLVQHNIPTATILLTNTGHSPALTTRVRLVMTVWTSNKFPDWEMPLKPASDAQSIGMIDPDSVVSQTVSLVAPLTDVQGMHLERKDWFIVILGAVSYIDTLNNPHETHLCLIWRDTSTDHLSPCEKWNEAD